MKLTSIILLGAAMLAGCGGTASNAGNSASNGANSVVNTMNSNAKNMPGENNNTGYVMNSNQTRPPAMPSNATNISPPSLSNNSNSHSNSKNTNSNKK